MHQPHLEEFTKLAKDHTLVPVYRTLLCDSLTPVSAFRRLEQGGANNRCACLFESVVGGERVGRYSFLTAEPFLEISATDRQVTLRHADGREETREVEDPLEVLRDELNRINAAHPDHPELPPFLGGAIGYAGYDVVRYTEHLPNAPQDDRKLPDMSFAFYDRMVIFDHIRKTLTIVVMADVSTQPAQVAWESAQQRLAEITELLSKQSDSLPIADISTPGELTLAYESNFDQADFEAAVNKCVEYIRAGDIFQVVISQRLQTRISVDPFEIYRTLRVVNPSPFMFYLRTSETTLVGSSPEIMVRVVDGKLTVRPLAGTRPRGADEAEDQRLADELLADPKERAEHVMLVDLGRNDVGRVARYRSVELSDVMTIERYSHVMHITSNVTGDLRKDTDAFDALRACLPAGTVSGAPKVRAMEIIDELEPHRRGPYAGAVGYLDYGGNMDTCIALRTMVVQGDMAYVQAGAGIVADSVPQSEYQETLNKARGLLRAIEITEKRARRRARRVELGRSTFEARPPGSTTNNSQMTNRFLAFVLVTLSLFAAPAFAEDRVTLLEDRENLITHVRVATEADGTIALADLFRAAARMNGYDDAELRDAIPECRVKLDSTAARWSVRAFNRVMRPCVQANTSGDALDLYVDRAAAQEWVNDCKADVRWAWSKLDWRTDAPEYGVSLLDDSDSERDIVVLIHGLNSQPEDLSGLLPAVHAANLTAATFRYPNDQPIMDSAKLLANELVELRKEFPHRKIRLLTHSMGGLVARAVIETNLNPDNVSQLIMIAPPNHGSLLAKIAGLMDCYDFCIDPDKRRIDTLMEAVTDGLGEATADLQPHSVFLDRLNNHPRNPEVQYTILLGSAGPMDEGEMEELRATLRDYTDGNRYFRFVTSKFNGAVTNLDEVVQGKGDGAVSVESGQLDDVSDVVVLPFAHASILNPRHASSKQAYEVVISRLTAAVQPAR